MRILSMIAVFIVMIMATSTTNAQDIPTQGDTLKSRIDTGITFKNATNKVRAVTEGALMKDVVDFAVDIYNELAGSMTGLTLNDVLNAGDTAGMQSLFLKWDGVNHAAIENSSGGGSLYTQDSTGNNRIGISTGDDGRYIFYKVGSNTLKITEPNLSTNRTIAWPDATGTVALTSSLTLQNILTNGDTANGLGIGLRWNGVPRVRLSNTSTGGLVAVYNTDQSRTTDIYAVGSDQYLEFQNNGNSMKIVPPSITTARTITLQDASGTVAFTSQVPTYYSVTGNGDGVSTSFTFTVASGLSTCIAQSTNTVSTVQSSSLSGTTVTVRTTAAPVLGTGNLAYTIWCH